MFSKTTIAIICVITNISLFLLMMHFDKQASMHLFFRLTRIAFAVSIMMQLLVATGIVKTPSKN